MNNGFVKYMTYKGSRCRGGLKKKKTRKVYRLINPIAQCQISNEYSLSYPILPPIPHDDSSPPLPKKSYKNCAMGIIMYRVRMRRSLSYSEIPNPAVSRKMTG